MDLEAVRNFCLTLPGVTEDIKWENNLCFSVGGKMVPVTNIEGDPVSGSFKTTEK